MDNVEGQEEKQGLGTVMFQWGLAILILLSYRLLPGSRTRRLKMRRWTNKDDDETQGWGLWCSNKARLPDVAVGSALTFRQDESLLLPALISTMMNIDNHIVTLDQYSFYSLRTLVQSTPPRPLSSKREYFANSPPRLITPAINLISQN